MIDSHLTVIMPAHNAEATIAAAIQSILYQSYQDFELWVLESNSTDRTAEVARSFTDPRVKVFELGALSFQDALIYGLENAKTEWLARMDADDLSFPDRFKEQMEVVEQRPDLLLVGTQRAYLTPFGHIFEPAEKVASKEVNRLSLRSKGDDRKFFVDASVMFKRSAALEVGGYDTEFQMGDVPLWFRLLSRGKGWEIARPLYLYRLHPTSMLYTKTGPSDQSYRLLAKYAPEQLYLYPEESAQRQKTDIQYNQKFWLRILEMELLTGDRQAILGASKFLERRGNFKKEAALLKLFVALEPFSRIYYQWRKRRQYRHRPDWEALFSGMVGSLKLDEKCYS
jgi:glycosyltransferase involved in cell wall biosynthesis